MYQVDAFSSLAGFVRASKVRLAWVNVAPNVLALGFTSLLTDVSSEMVNTVLPIYLVLHLGVSPLRFGVVDGLYNGATALLLIAGGVVADRARRYKEVASVGYAASTLCKIGLIAAGRTWSLIVAMVVIDRAAKGVRTAPRDALISLSSSEPGLGVSFGVHRAMDSVGAMLGPLVALAILTMLPNGFDVVFMTSFCIGAVGVGVIVLFVQNKERAAGGNGPARLTAGAIGQLVYTVPFRTLMLCAFLLSLATVSDSFLYLALQQRVGFRAALVPLLYVGTATSYLLLAIPAGRLADLFGRRRIFLFGHVILALAYSAALERGPGWTSTIFCVVALGGYYAMTDGVLAAQASAILPPAIRGTGLACAATLTSAGRFTSSLLFGALWTAHGLAAPLVGYLVALLVAVAFGAAAFGWAGQRNEQPTPAI
jgi:MFS family permease